MAEPPRGDRDRRTDEDLFEDLDQFFAPLEDDWPEEEGADTPGRPVEARPAPAAVEPERDVDQPVAADEAARERPGDEGLLDATAELRPEEWDLSDEVPEAEASAPATPAPPAGGLTPADLRTPPPAYARLPGPPDEPEEAEPETRPDDDVVPDDATMEDFEVPLAFDDDFLTDDEPAPASSDERVVRVSAADRGPTADVPVEDVVEPAEDVEEAVEEPSGEADVEAAAEHFASGLRAEPDDVERDLLGDLEEPVTRTAPIDRDAVLEQAAREPVPAAPTVTAPGSGRAADEGLEASPSWEDAGSTAAAVSDEPAPAQPRAEQRNLVAAFASGILLLAAAIALLAIGKGAFAVLAGAVILLAQGELYAVMRRRGFEPATLLGLAAGGLIVAAAYLKGEGAMLFGLSLAMLLVVLWYMAAPPAARKGTLRDAGVTILGVVYVPFLAGFAMLLLRATGATEEDVGRNLFLVVVGLTVLYDIAAYAVGSIWGSRPLAPTISPRKSWEGALGATLIVLIAALSVVSSVEPFTGSFWTVVGLAFVVSVAAPLGDLVESALKRDLGVKDMSGLLPGHGGMLDRIDAIIFAAPAAYWFLRIAFTG